MKVLKQQQLFDFIVVGLGKTGLSCARFLAGRGYAIAVTDSRPNPPGADQLRQEWPTVPCSLGGFDQTFLAQAKCIVMSPGVSCDEPAIAYCRELGIPVWSDIELFIHFNPTAAIVAITGTNGKSTVTTLVGEMAKAAGIAAVVGGNIGVAVMDLLGQPLAELYVLELSSFQLDTTHHLQARAATILNITPDHLDRYADFAHYAAAKHRIYQGAQCIVYNRDDVLTMPQQLPAAATMLSFGLQAPEREQDYGLLVAEGSTYLARGSERLLATQQLKIQGKQNWANALAALALGDALNLPLAAMLSALTTFPGLTHRCQWVRSLQGVNWYNDSKGTNVGAAIAAIQGLGATTAPGKLILIAGGQGKGADFSDLRASVSSFVRHVILIGQDADHIAEALDAVVPMTRAQSFIEAVNMAYQYAQAGDAVLLSPACASFDMFKNFEHRGEMFVELVTKL